MSGIELMGRDKIERGERGGERRGEEKEDKRWCDGSWKTK